LIFVSFKITGMVQLRCRHGHSVYNSDRGTTFKE
jgi:hypothetical protein